MGRFVFALLFGVFLACGLHIILLLMLPFSQPDRLWQRLVALGEPHQFHALSGLPHRDPLMLEVVCRFTLATDPISIALPVPPPDTYWALSVFDRSAALFFTMSDSSAPNGRPSLLLANEAEEAVEETGDALLLELPAGAYFVTFKRFAPDTAQRAEAKDPPVSDDVMLSEDVKLLEDLALSKDFSLSDDWALSSDCAPVPAPSEPVYEPRLKPGELPTPLPKPRRRLGV